MLHLVLAEAELELVPEPLRGHPSVTKPAKRHDKRPSRSLLDSSVHHEALKHFPEGDRRGRPDLVHFFMLLGLDSVLNQHGELRLYVHTRNDELIRVAPETRIMRNYNRFVGLVEQLFHNGAVPKASPLLVLESGWTLARVLREAVPAGVPKVAFREAGRRVAPREYFSERAKAGRDLCVLVGGFPKGDFKADVASLVDDTVSLGAATLSVWTVAMEVIPHWEAALGHFDADVREMDDRLRNQGTGTKE